MPEFYYRDERDYREVESFVGADFFHDADQEEIAAGFATNEARRLAFENPARAAIFADATRCMLEVRNGAELDQRKVGRYRNYLEVLNNLESYIGGRSIELDLYGHQVDVFQDIYDFMSGPPRESSGNPIQRAGFIEMPTGTGKTAIFVKLVEAMAGNGPDRLKKPIKSLILVPTRAIRSQTEGDHPEKGFDLLSKQSDLTISSFAEGEGYDTNGDVVVMTYQAFASKKYRDRLRDVDLVICDEAHRAIGVKTRGYIQDFARDKVLLGFTATSEYAVNHSVDEVFDRLVHKMTYPEAAELGIIQPVQGYIYETGVELEDVKSWKFTAEEYESLIEAEGRTRKGVEFAAALVARGLQGVVTCIPGENRSHAKEVANLLRGKEVTLADGTSRLISAASIDGTMKSAEQEEILNCFSDGKIDVLCYVDLLNEGWDDDSARFLVNLRPTESPVLAKQRVGRVIRKNENHPPTVVIDFVDDTKKLQQTFIHTFRLAEFEQGRVIGSEASSGTHEQGAKAVTLPEWMSSEIRNVNADEIYQRLITEKVSFAPEGFLSLREFADMVDLHYTQVHKVVKELELEPGRYIAQSGHIAFHLNPEQQGQIASWIEANRPGEDLASIQDLAKELGMSSASLQQLARDNGLRSFQHGIKRLYDKEDVATVVEHLQQTKEMTEGLIEDVPVTNFLVYYDEVGPNELLRTIKHLGIRPHLKTIQNRTQMFVTREESDHLHEHLSVNLSATAEWRTLEDLSELTGLSEQDCAAALSHIRGYSFQLKILKDKGGIKRPHLKIEDFDYSELDAQMSDFLPPAEGFETIEDLRKRFGKRAYDDLSTVLSQLHIRPKAYREPRRGIWKRYLIPSQVDRFETFMNSDHPPDFIAKKELLERLEITPQKLGHLRRRFGVQPNLYPNKEGKLEQFFYVGDFDRFEQS